MVIDFSLGCAQRVLTPLGLFVFLDHFPVVVGGVPVVGRLSEGNIHTPDKSRIPHPIGEQPLRGLNALNTEVEGAGLAQISREKGVFMLNARSPGPPGDRMGAGPFTVQS
jgi:hypothetical protein